VRERLIPLIVASLREVGEERTIALPAQLDDETRLFGEGGVLDSLGLVSLVVLVEQAVEDTTGVTVSLANRRALARRNNPFETIGALADYAGERLRAEGWDG
jgi:acyl carrier protein